MKIVLFFSLFLLLVGCKKKEDEAPTGTGDISMSVPYLNSSDVQGVFEAYSTGSNSPWGFAHNGIDFFPKGNLMPIKAVAPGKVVELKLWRNNQSVNYQVNVSVQYNSLYTVLYIFEPFSDKESDGQTQLQNILVANGRNISAGQLIGKLYAVGNGSHVHFGLNKDGNATCPEAYFNLIAKDSLLNTIHKTRPGWNLCY